MRSDMHKVICEEPRHGGGPEKQMRRANLSEELLPRFEGIRRPHINRKWFGEHLGPLRRWLRSQVGRPWNAIYGEACAVIKPDSVVRNHIKFHLLEFVHRHAYLRDGRVWCFTAGWLEAELPIEKAASRWSPFYVHPVTGALCEVQSQPRRRWRENHERERAKALRWLTDSKALRLLNGLWFECDVSLFQERFVRGDEPAEFDFAERRPIDVSQAKNIYGKPVFCHAKRQLSRSDLKKLGLRNSTQLSVSPRR